MLQDYIQMSTEENPLIELAVRLGYTVFRYYLEPPPDTLIPRYRIDNGLGRSNEGNDLVDVLTFMIKRDMMAFTTPTM